jgi:predicted DNA-binding protein (MmcQ/YjbR family)
VDIINVKCGSALIGALLTQPGYLPAYHMSKGSWLTILLDGTVDLKEVIALVDLSHQMTDTKIKPRKNSR